MFDMVKELEQNCDYLESLIREKGHTYRLEEFSRLKATIKEMKERDMVMEKIIEMLTLEIERIEYLSDWLYSQGEMARGFYRKNEAEQLQAIIEVMQEKT